MNIVNVKPVDIIKSRALTDCLNNFINQGYVLVETRSGGVNDATTVYYFVDLQEYEEVMLSGGNYKVTMVISREEYVHRVDVPSGVLFGLTKHIIAHTTTSSGTAATGFLDTLYKKSSWCVDFECFSTTDDAIIYNLN